MKVVNLRAGVEDLQVCSRDPAVVLMNRRFATSVPGPLNDTWDWGYHLLTVLPRLKQLDDVGDGVKRRSDHPWCGAYFFLTGQSGNSAYPLKGTHFTSRLRREAELLAYLQAQLRGLCRD